MNVASNILKDFLEAAHTIGGAADMVQGGGGNLSIKIDARRMLVKASGCTLKDVSETRGLVIVEYPPIVERIAELKQPFTAEDEEPIFALVQNHTTPIGDSVRASMEIGFHALLPRAVIHTHSVYVNIVTCSQEGERIATELSKSLDRPILWVPHAPPGFSLALFIAERLRSYSATHGTTPHIIFLQNHGVIVTADQVVECLRLHEQINKLIQERFAITAPYPDTQILMAHNPKFFEQFSTTILFPDQAVYGAGSNNTPAREETRLAYAYIREQIDRAGLTLCPLPKPDVEYILSMESEKYRKSLEVQPMTPYKKITSIVNKHSIFLVVMLLLFGFFYAQRLNVNTVYYGQYNDDEYHTIHEGIGFLTHGRVENFRAQESVRWLVRLFYPYALVQMNTSMGGNVFIDDWQYPGHFYVQKNFIDSYNVDAINKDPNLRVLFFSLRKLYLLFVLASFLPLLYFLYKKRYNIAALGTVILLGINIDLIHEQKLFYIEPAMLAGLNLCLFAYLYLLDTKKLSKLQTIAYALVCAFTVATKFSTLPFLLLPILAILFIHKSANDRLSSLLIFFLSFVGGYLLINFPAFLSLQNFNQFIHDLSSNFWQYAAGSSSAYTVAAGGQHLSLILAQLEGLFGYSLYLLPLFILLAWKYATSDERKIIIPIGALTIIICLAISSQYVYFTRNTVPFYAAAVLAPLLCLDILYRHISRRRFAACASILIILTLTGNIVYAGGTARWANQLFPSAKKEFLANVLKETSTVSSTYAIGFSDSFFAKEPYRANITVLPNAPAALSSGTYEFAEKKYRELTGNAIVLVKKIGNNKHLTNYILPKYFKKNRQYGDYFIFSN